MAGQTQTAQAKVKLDVQGNAAKSVLDLAAALDKAAQAEDKLQAKMKARAQLDAAAKATTFDKYYKDVHGRAAPDRAGMTPDQRAAHDTLEDSFDKYKAANPMTLGGRLAGSTLGRLAGRLAPLAGPAAAAATLGKLAASAAIESGEIEAMNPLMSGGERDFRTGLSVPGLGLGLRTGADFYEYRMTDIGKKAGLSRLEGDYGEERARAAARVTGLYNSTGVDVGAARARADAAGDYAAVRVAGGDRSTAPWQRKYDEDRQLQGARTTLQNAMLERATAERRSAALANRERDTGVELTRARAALAKATEERRKFEQLGPNAANRDLIEARVAREREARAAADALGGEHEGAVRASSAARQDVARAQSGVRQGERGIALAQLAQLEQREQTAAGQARTLGGMGPQGRLQSELALKAIRQIGVDNVTAEERAAARAVGPLTVGKLEENSGGRFAGRFRDLAPDDYRDRLPDVRKQVDRERGRVADLEDIDVRATAEGLAGAVAGVLEELVAEFTKQLDEKIANVERDAARRNNQPGG